MLREQEEVYSQKFLSVLDFHLDYSCPKPTVSSTASVNLC